MARCTWPLALFHSSNVSMILLSLELCVDAMCPNTRSPTNLTSLVDFSPTVHLPTNVNTRPTFRKLTYLSGRTLSPHHNNKMHIWAARFFAGKSTRICALYWYSPENTSKALCPKSQFLSLWRGAQSVTTKVSKLSKGGTCVYIGG